MKTSPFVPTSLSLALAIVTAPFALGQGALFPPSDPAPTMKTLDQLEPRTIINQSNTPGDAENSFIIRAAGSYYLTGNITGTSGKHGISVQAADVTLDLNGFVLVGNGDPTGNGIEVSATATSFCTRNGSIRDWRYGVNASAAGALVEKLRLTGNETGLQVGNGGIVRDCVATANFYGFICADRTQVTNCIATVNIVGFDCSSFVSLFDCTASRNESLGFRVQDACSLSRCSATRSTSGWGITAQDGCTLTDCTTSNNKAGGIAVTRGSSVVNCTASGNNGTGIWVSSPGGSTVRGCTSTGNTIGIEIYDGTQNRVDGNTCNVNTDAGFSIGGSRHLVTRNSASGNGTDYSFSSATTAVAIDLRVGGSDANIPPWANVIY